MNKQDLLELGKKYIKENKKFPKGIDWKISSGYTSRETILNEFGSWSNFLKELGKEPHNRNSLIELGKKYIEENKKLPISLDWTKKAGYCNIKLIYREFGNWDNFLLEIGCKDYFISLLYVYVEKYGELPQYPGSKKSKWTSYNGFTGAAIILRFFNSWKEFTDSYKKRYKVKLTGKYVESEEIIKKYLSNKKWIARKYTKEQYIEAVINRGSIHKYLNVSEHSISNLHKNLYINKPSAVPPFYFILYVSGYKHCNSCNKTMLIENFSKDFSRWDKTNTICKLCNSRYNKENSHKLRYSRDKRREIIKSSIIEEEKQEIAIFYKNCPTGYHVDHIIPLSKGGTHTLDNLQYLTAEDNLRKGNKIVV